MSEELLQRDLIKHPDKIGNWLFYNIGATTIKNLKQNNIIENIDYGDIENRKPDGIIVFNKKVIAIIENKKPSEFNTESKKAKAITQALEVGKALNSKLAIITDTNETLWINCFNGEKILDEDGKVLTTNFDYKDNVIGVLIQQILDSVDERNSQIKTVEKRDPTPLAKQIWQDIWTVSGATPENCLYTFVEIFIFKYLSDLNVLRGIYNFNNIIEMYKTNTENEVLETYAKTVRPKIKELFPRSEKDNTTIINGTIFVSKDDKAIEGYSGVFRKILFRFKDYGKLQNIDYDFKSKLFESFLKESISKKNWGQFFTPLKVVKPMVKMADIRENMKICDPACGVGKFLLESILPSIKDLFLIDNGHLKQKIELRGFDKGFDKEEQRTIILAKANMLIYFSDLIKENVNITKEFSKVFNDTFILKTNSILGTLRDPIENEYDLILTNPPYVTSGSSNLKEEIKKDETLENYYKVNALGVEGLFMEWIVKALKPQGKAFIVIPDGILNRQNDSNLRKFIMDNCYIDALISLPLNTFFTTNKKTYILALTKKQNINQIQEEPIFSYIVSDIGETLDINRFETGENQLEYAVQLFNQFKGAKNYFKTDDKRCKIIPIDFFERQYQKDWIVDNLWSNEEKIQLGMIEKTKVMTVSEFSNFIGEVSSEIAEYQSLFLEVDEKKKIDVEWEKYKIKDIFEISKGKSKYTKKYGQEHKGIFPIYSASNIAPLTYCDSYDFDGKYLTWASNGFAGYMKVLDGKFSINGDRGILLPRQNNILLEYIKIILEPKLRELAKGRKGEKGKDEFTKVYPSMIENIEILLPINKETMEISVEYQKDEVYKYQILSEFKNKINQNKSKITNNNLDIKGFEKTKKYKISDLFTIEKGLSKYTNKYFVKNKGNFPVYSSQTFNEGIIANINTYDYDCNCITWTTDGVYAGTVFLRNGKFSMTTHCGALMLKKEFDGIIDLEYIYAVLFNKLKQFANGEQNKRVTVNIIKNIYVDIPLDKNNKTDIDKQKEYSKTFNKFKLAKKEVISRLDKLLEINII